MSKVNAVTISLCSLQKLISILFENLNSQTLYRTLLRIITAHYHHSIRFRDTERSTGVDIQNFSVARYYSVL
jgi:hypothetical protein